MKNLTHIIGIPNEQMLIAFASETHVPALTQYLDPPLQVL